MTEVTQQQKWIWVHDFLRARPNGESKRAQARELQAAYQAEFDTSMTPFEARSAVSEVRGDLKKRKPRRGRTTPATKDAICPNCHTPHWRREDGGIMKCENGHYFRRRQ